MKIVQPDSSGIKEAVSVLQAGGVVAHATETCYGFACDMQNLSALEKLFAIKHRPKNMPVSALFESIVQAQEYVDLDDQALKLANDHLPGPLTIIVPIKTTGSIFPCPDASVQTVGIRISPLSVAMELVTTYTKPISTTSANIHGLPNPYSVEEIQNQFKEEKDQPDIILDSGTLENNDSSTVIRVTDNNIEVLRQGSIEV